jgi:hypothetical protein
LRSDLQRDKGNPIILGLQKGNPTKADCEAVIHAIRKNPRFAKRANPILGL